MARILLKLSGEALAGSKGYGIDHTEVKRIAKEIKDLNDHGHQIAVVIGGGNSALEESIYLAGLARSVTIVIRRDVFRAEEHIQKQIEENAKIHVIKKHIPVRILSSEGKVSGIELENVDTHEKQVIECSGIFPYVGQDPNTDCVQDLGILNERGYVLVDDDRQTKIPGIYAAGDVIDKNLRQVITACNDGAIAERTAIAQSPAPGSVPTIGAPPCRGH